MQTNIFRIIEQGLETLFGKAFDIATETFETHTALQQLQKYDPTITRIELVHDAPTQVTQQTCTYVEGLGNCRIYRE